MPNLATWIRSKDDKWFQPFFAKHPDIHVFNARKGDVALDQMGGLLLTGGSDISPEFLRQEILDPSVLDKQIDPERDRWEFKAVKEAVSRGLPILAICLYHALDHLWSIPLWLQSLGLPYRFFLRRYSDAGWEQVCYAIPEDRLARN